MAKVKEIGVESGVSIETAPSIWYKFRCNLTVEVEEGDDIEEVKKKLWNTAHNEVEKQVREVTQK